MLISKNNQNLEIRNMPSKWNKYYEIIAENPRPVFPYSARFTRVKGFASYKSVEEFINKYLK